MKRTLIAACCFSVISFAPLAGAGSEAAELTAEIHAALQAGDTERAQALARQLREITEAEQARETAEIEAARDERRLRQKESDFERLRAHEAARRAGVGEAADTARSDAGRRLPHRVAARRSAPVPSDRALAMPEGFPIPFPDGGRVITDGWNGERGHITLRYPAGRHREILSFYDERAEGPGWRRKELGRGDTPTVNYMNLSRGRNISVDPPQGQHLIVTLTVS